MLLCVRFWISNAEPFFSFAETELVKFLHLTQKSCKLYHGRLNLIYSEVQLLDVLWMENSQNLLESLYAQLQKLHPFTFKLEIFFLFF